MENIKEWSCHAARRGGLSSVPHKASQFYSLITFSFTFQSVFYFDRIFIFFNSKVITFLFIFSVTTSVNSLVQFLSLTMHGPIRPISFIWYLVFSQSALFRVSFRTCFNPATVDIRACHRWPKLLLKKTGVYFNIF